MTVAAAAAEMLVLTAVKTEAVVAVKTGASLVAAETVTAADETGVTVSTMADGGGRWETTTEMMGAGNNNLKQQRQWWRRWLRRRRS